MYAELLCRCSQRCAFAHQDQVVWPAANLLRVREGRPGEVTERSIARFAPVTLPPGEAAPANRTGGAAARADYATSETSLAHRSNDVEIVVVRYVAGSLRQHARVWLCGQGVGMAASAANNSREQSLTARTATVLNAEVTASTRGHAWLDGSIQ